MNLAATRIARALLAASCLLPVGCASRPSTTGVRIGDETLRQFKAGETTEAWLVAVLGPPSSRSVVEGLPNTEVFRYSLVESGGGLMSVFTGGGSKNTSVVYFILTDGIVTRFWADRQVERTVLGGRVEESGGEKTVGSSLLP